jgi:hypothetical protein
MRAILAVVCLLAIAAIFWDARASDDSALPPDVAKALHSATKVELYSLEPWFDESAKESKWHDYVLLGHTTLSGDKAKLAVKEFESTIKGPNVSACFDPRHGLRVESAGHVYDLLLCYECNGLAIYVDDKYLKKYGAMGSPKVLNKLLSDAKVPLSQSASD